MAQMIEKNIKQCAATLEYNENNQTLRYIEQEKSLSKEHIELFNELRNYVDDILNNKIIWKLSKLPLKLLQIVDNNPNDSDKCLGTMDMYNKLEKYANTQTLIAICMGSNYNIDIAKQCILDIVQWRVQSKIDKISPKLFKNSLQTKTVFNVNEFDKCGHPICHFNVLESPPDDPWTIVRAAVYSMEKCIKLAERNNLYQILWIVDFEFLSYSTMPPIEILKEVSNLMTYYYPERLYKSYLLFSPWIFSAMFKMFVPYLPQRTQQKIINPGWYESASYDTFKSDVDKSSLSVKFGGDNKEKYDYEWEQSQFDKQKGHDVYISSFDDCAKENIQKDEEDVKDKKDKNEMENDDDAALCVVCLDGKKDFVMVPCGHICICENCKDLFTKDDATCPICRIKVEKVIKTFN